MEPPNKGHVGTKSYVLYRKVSFIRRLKCTGIVDLSFIERFPSFGVSFVRGSTVQVFQALNYNRLVSYPFSKKERERSKRDDYGMLIPASDLHSWPHPHQLHSSVG